MRKAVFVGNGVASVRHLIDHVNLGYDGLLSGALHQGLDVTDSQTNEEVHDDDGEQNHVGSKEKMGGSYKFALKSSHIE